MKREYLVTDAAGATVAGLRSPGANKPIMLTESQAEHPLRQGYIREPDPLDHDRDGRKGGSRKRPTAEKVDE